MREEQRQRENREEEGGRKEGEMQGGGREGGRRKGEGEGREGGRERGRESYISGDLNARSNFRITHKTQKHRTPRISRVQQLATKYVWKNMW